MTVEELVQRIGSVPAEKRKTTPMPQDWLADHQTMLNLVDAGILGMDGFRYQFREYAQECWRRCHLAS